MTAGIFTNAAAALALAGAEAAIAGAKAEAVRRGLQVTIAVVDRGGVPLALARMDGIHVGTVAVAIAKARTAALYNRPTAAFARAMADGATGLLGLPDLVPFPGGLPLIADGATLGAIGVSGAAPDVDEAIAAAGVDAFLKGPGG